MIAYVGEHFVPIACSFICKIFMQLNTVVVRNTVEPPPPPPPSHPPKKIGIRPTFILSLS